MRNLLWPGISGVLKAARLIIILQGLAFTDVSGQQTEHITPGNTKLLVYTPPRYHAGTTNHPVLIFLHGESEAGEDLAKLAIKTSSNIPPKLIAQNQWNRNLPFIVVSPQRPRRIQGTESETWSAIEINEVLEYVRKNYRTDLYRIYVTGIQDGATAAYMFAATYPEKVAALLAIAGKPNANVACSLKNIPLWIFHGSSDHLVPVRESVDFVSRVKNCASAGIFTPRLNIMNAREQDIWNELYDGSAGVDIYTWFLRFRKNNTTNKAPYVNAGADRTIAESNNPQYLTGDYFDWDGTIKKIQWSQTMGPRAILTGEHGALLTITKMQAGEYEFQLSVTDDKGLISSDRVRIVVVANIQSSPRITGLILVDGASNRDVGMLTDGMVVNKTTLGLSEVNVRAAVSPGVNGVTFRINNDHLTRKVTGAGPYWLQKPSRNPEWSVANGTYLICATPHSASGSGSDFCVRVSVTSSGSSSFPAAPVVDPSITIKSIDDILISNMPQGNQWVFNGNDIPGATGSVYKPTVPGEYFVRLVDRPVNNISNSVLIESPKHNQVQVAFGVMSAPSREFLLVTGESVPSKAHYRLIRSGGELIQEGSLRDDFRIPLSADIQKGDYVVMIRTKVGNQSAKVRLQ